MYLADALRGARLQRPGWRRVATGNVVALGLVSLATDVSSEREMVTAVLPAYLVLGLHLSLAQYGLLDGIYTGATAVTRLLGGWCADRFQARKLVAGLGYGLSALAKVGLLVVSAPVAIGGVLAIDRTGKGLRTAPRDALIALSVDERDLGQAFGLHRAMDSTGAFLGPLAALGLLALAGSASYDSVFVGSLCAALIGLIVLSLFVDNRAGAVRAPGPADSVSRHCFASRLPRPSLSPDDRRLVYKKRLPDLTWQLWVYDLATRQRTQLAEPGNVDDQGAWLDPQTVAYGKIDENTGQVNIWSVPADGTGAPRLIAENAESPAGL